MPHRCAIANRRFTDAVVPTGITVLTHGHGPRTGLHAEPVCPNAGAPDPACHHARCPRSWVPSTQHTTQTGIRDVHHQGNQAAQGTANVPDGQHGIGHSIRPATATPLTVLVAEMLNGSVLLQG
jgi:hypothetical protein